MSAQRLFADQPWLKVPGTWQRNHLGIKPGYRLDWQPVEGKDEILVRIIPDRGELARRLLGAGRRFSPERDAVAELVAERAEEG